MAPETYIYFLGENIKETTCYGVSLIYPPLLYLTHLPLPCQRTKSDIYMTCLKVPLLPNTKDETLSIEIVTKYSN